MLGRENIRKISGAVVREKVSVQCWHLDGYGRL